MNPSKQKWIPKTEPPTNSGWFYTLDKHQIVSARYYDHKDHSWWKAGRFSGWMSADDLTFWFRVLNVSDKQVPV